MKSIPCAGIAIVGTLPLKGDKPDLTDDNAFQSWTAENILQQILPTAFPLSKEVARMVLTPTAAPTMCLEHYTVVHTSEL